MIAFPSKLPQVVWHENRVVPLSEGWLAESIATAADRAGYQQWDLAPQVARALTLYLEQDFDAPVVTVENLLEMIRRSLEGIGFPEVARASAILPPRVSIYLPELANHAGYEMLFFPMLKDRLSEAIDYRVRGIKLEGIRDCVKILDNAFKWRQTCELLSDEIVAFTRAHFAKNRVKEVELVIC